MARKPVSAADLAKKAATNPGTKMGQMVTALYDAAGGGRRFRGWTPPTSGPNRALQGLQTIRNRSRDSVRNDWAGESTVQKWATALVGIAITPRFKGITNKARKKVVTDLWNDWLKVADADHVLDIYGMQTLAVRSWIESGELFIRARPRDFEGPQPVSIQFQLIEADQCPLSDFDQHPKMPKGNRVRQGIEFNSFGRRVAYWFFKEHPNDARNQNDPDPDALVRVAASQISHMFEPKRIGQIRGVPTLVTSLPRLRDTMDYEDAVLQRQKIANLFVAFLTKELPKFNEWELGALTGATQETEETVGFDGMVQEKAIASLEPGLMQELMPGEDVKFANPPEAGTMYSEYLRSTHMGVAAGAGLPYELYSGDILNISDRTLRVLINEFRRFAQQRQWQIVIPMMCQFVIDQWVDAAVLDGTISLDEAADVKRVEHAPHGWEYIHPVQDVQGKMLEVMAGFRSRSSVIGEAGDDAEAIDDERAADKKREKALDLFVDPAAASTTVAKPTIPAPTPAK